jgi:predicted nucleic acid-binding protein
LLAIDTSAIVARLLGRPAAEGLSERLEGADLVAPHLIDVEFLHVLRRLVHQGEITADRASDARVDFGDLSVTRYPHAPLADAIWGLRHNLSAYDAAFVALAEALSVPLVTCDARLAASRLDADVELYS